MPNGIQNLYDFETWLEDGFACALIDKGLAVVTTRGAFEKFQQARPRIQLRFVTHGTKQGQGPVITAGDYSSRHASFTGMLQTMVIANGVGTGSEALRRYRAQLRNAMAELRPFTAPVQSLAINGTRPTGGYGDDPLVFGSGTQDQHSIAIGDQYLAFHAVQNIIETSNSNIQTPEDGVEAQEIEWQVDFGMRADAWAELTTNP